MYNYHLLEDRDVLCIDQKSFFASVSCIEKGLDPLETKLAVVADTKRQGSVVLAATPKLKELGIKTGSRLFEIPHRNDIYIHVMKVLCVCVAQVVTSQIVSTFQQL